MATSRHLNDSAVNLMRISGFIFLAVVILYAVLEIIGNIFTILTLAIISSVLAGLAIVFLSLSLGRTASISHKIIRNSNIASGLLISYILINILSKIFYSIPNLTTAGVVVGILALLARILAFQQVNDVFKQVSKFGYKLDSRIFSLYGWFAVLAATALIITAITANPLVVIIALYTIIAGEILLLFAVGYKLIQNSNKIKLVIQDRTPKIIDVTPELAKGEERPLLEVKNLKTYFHTKAGAVKAVDNVSFKLRKGEVLGLAGESGCGKTTTCLSIMQMVDFPGEIMDGQIIYDNAFEIIEEEERKRFQDRIFNDNNTTVKRSKNILEFSEPEMRKIRGNHISMIFQGAMNALNPVHRVGNQILEVLNIHEPELEKDEAWQKVIDILETVGIDSARARDYPFQLSGGMKQRALIAMALVNNPDIVIADEPVTALDVIVQSQVLKATKELQRKFDLSMIMITHDLSVIAEVCETLAIMYAGKLVEYGDLRTLFKEPYHPYTQALINAFPSITGPKKELYDIGGSPPDLRNPPSGCRFHPRCPKVMPICSEKEPSNTPVKNGFVACWLYEKEEK